MSDDNAEVDMVLDVNLALKMIPEFHGDRENLHKFISCCDVVSAMATTRNDAEMFMNIIKTKLTGVAYNLVKYKTYESWNELKVILQEQYLEHRTFAQIQTELLNSKQGYNEDVRSFANRLERLTCDLNDACIASEGPVAARVIQNLNNKSCLKAFVEGLRDPIKLIIKASRYDTFPRAVEAGCEEERNIKPYLRKPKFQSSKNTNNDRCFKCGKSGHIASNCYSNTGNFSRYPTFPSVPIKREINISQAESVCRYCKRPGHELENCRKRQYNNARKHTRPNIQSGNHVTNNYTNRPHNIQNIENSGNEHGPGTSGSVSRIRDLKTA